MSQTKVAVEDKDPEIYSCSVCSKSYTRKDSLKRHIVGHSSNPRPYSCDLCGNKYTQSKSLYAHRRDVHEGTRKTPTFKCDLCPAVFNTRILCQAHVRRFHNNIPEDKDSALTEPKQPGQGPESGKRKRRRGPRGLMHKCSICKASLSSQRKLELHTCPGHRPPPETFQCPHCPRMFDQADLFRSHTTSHQKLLNGPETNEPSKDFECPACKLLWPGPLTLAVHNCTNEYQHKCPHCPQRFRALKFLNHHIRIHLNTRTHKSQYCSRTFHHRKDLTRHERTHTEKGLCFERPKYMETCRICGATFVTTVLLKQHLLAKHNRPCSIPVDRLLINPASSFEANCGGLALCNTCGDWFTEPDYRLHRVLCDTGNEVDWMERAGDWVRTEEQTHFMEPEELEVRYSPPPSPMDNSHAASESNDNDWAHLTVDEPTSDESTSFEGQDVKPDIGLLRLEHQHTTCKLCGQVLPSSDFAGHFHEKHNQQLSVPVVRTLFKEMNRGFSGLLLVRPCEDTFHIPWFMCSRCGRTFIRKVFALQHKRQGNCALKPNHIEPGHAVRPGQRRKSVGWKEAWQVPDPPQSCPSQNLNERIVTVEGGLFQCTVCNRMYETQEKGRLHARGAHREKFMCETCGLALSSREAYEQHLRIHTGEMPYSCSTCHKRFRCRSTLIRHKRNVHPIRINEPAAAAAQDKQLKCMECQTLYNNYEALRNHIIETHPTNPLNTAHYPCYQCSRQFTLKGSLEKHWRLAHGIKPQYKCNECSKILNRPFTLRRHMLVFHPKDGANKMKWFGCKLCHKEYGLIMSIRKHLRKEHANVLPAQLLIENNSKLENGNVVFSMEDYFVRK